MPCHLGAYTVDLMTDSSALLQASSCSLGSEDVLGGTPQVQVLHQGRPRARQNFHLCPGHKHPNSKQFGEQQNRIKTGSKQDKQGPAQQSRCTTRNLLRRVLPPGLLKQDKAQRWQRTWKNCGNSAFPGTFQKDSGRQLVSADWPRLACTTGEALSDLPSRKLTTQAIHQDHPNGFGQCRSGSPPSISQLCKVSDDFVNLRLFMSLLQAKFQSFSTVAVYQFRSSSQSASTRFPLSIQIEAVNQRRTSRINLFLGLQNCHRRAPKHCEITPVSTTLTYKGSGKG